MSLSFPGRSRPRTARIIDQPAHQTESTFVMGKCRFLVQCTCGSSIETRYIGEALEWQDLHTTLAPLSDQLTA